MVEIKFLENNDLRRILPNLNTATSYKNRPLLERGFIALGDDLTEPYCEFILFDPEKGYRGPRYKVIAAVGEVEKEDGSGTELLPTRIKEHFKYKNFGFTLEEEVAIYRNLKQALRDRGIDANTFFEKAKISGISKRELIEIADEKIEKVLGVNGAAIGMMLGSLIYLSLETAGVQSSDFLPYLLGTSIFLGGFLESSLPLVNERKRMKKEYEAQVSEYKTSLESIVKT